MLTGLEVRKKRDVSWLRIPLIASVTVALSFIGFSLPVLSDSPLCKSLKHAERVNLQTLFLLSQLAERPEDISPKEPTDCFKEKTQLAPPMPAMGLIPVSDIMPHTERLRSRLRDIHDIQEAFIEPSPLINNMLHVGCQHTIFNIDVAVEMRFFRRDSGADIVQLDVVRRPLGGSSSEWGPLIQPDGAIVDLKTNVVSLPGTDSFRLFWANFGGEKCVFPAARFTINAICEYANSEESKTSSTSLRIEDGKPTLVGHSLGGAAAQYIATSRPYRGESKCPGVDAYAFGSTGLTPQSPNIAPAIRGTLTSYVSECDWLVQLGFSSRIQPGRLFTLSRTKSHFIDDIQGDICDCLRDMGNHRFGEHKSSRSPPQNQKLCLSTR